MRNKGNSTQEVHHLFVMVPEGFYFKLLILANPKIIVACITWIELYVSYVGISAAIRD